MTKPSFRPGQALAIESRARPWVTPAPDRRMLLCRLHGSSCNPRWPQAGAAFAQPAQRAQRAQRARTPAPRAGLPFGAGVGIAAC